MQKTNAGKVCGTSKQKSIDMKKYYLTLSLLIISLFSIEGQIDAGFTSVPVVNGKVVFEQYKGTRTADLARAYAGITYNRLGNNEKALEHLKKFKGGDLLITPAVTGAIGDVYMNMGKTDEAITHFLKAAKEADDEMLSPIYYKKAGEAYLSNANYDKAIEIFTQIRENYYNSPEAQEADKFIQQAELRKETK